MNLRKFYVIVIVCFIYFFLVVSQYVYADTSEFEVSAPSEDEFSDAGEGSNSPFPEGATLSQPEVDFSGVENKLNEIIKSLEQINKVNSQFEIYFQDLESVFLDLKKDVSSIYSKMSENEIQKREVENQQEITMADLHDDNVKIMVCIFVLLGVLLGFFMISKVLT